MATILALDPGLSTGWALFSYHDREPELLSQGTIVDGVRGFAQFWRNLPWIPDEVVSEKFIIAPDTVGEGWSLQVEGALLALYDGGVTWQLRSAKADLVTGTETQRFAWLRERGFTGSTHELDAITHALLYLKRKRHVPTIRHYWTEWGR